jgi:hypothetical protein
LPSPVVVRGPSCILEGALRFASARFGEGRDRWSIVREKLSHFVNVADSSFTSEKPTSQYRHRHRTSISSLRDRKGTPDQSGTTMIEATFYFPFFPLDQPGRSNGEVWLHENCGDRDRAEHDLGRIVIKENDISGSRISILLKVKLDISEDGLLFRKPILLKISRGTQEQIPITWESSNLSFSKDMMDNVRVQLADEMKTFHHQYNLTVDGN